MSLYYEVSIYDIDSFDSKADLTYEEAIAFIVASRKTASQMAIDLVNHCKEFGFQDDIIIHGVAWNAKAWAEKIESSSSHSISDMLIRLGWTQKYFARRIGVDEKSVTRWCHGSPNPIAMEYLRFSCHVMGV